MMEFGEHYKDNSGTIWKVGQCINGKRRFFKWRTNVNRFTKRQVKIYYAGYLTVCDNPQFEHFLNTNEWIILQHEKDKTIG